MSLDKVRQANKKAKHERKRKLRRDQVTRESAKVKVRQRKMRKLFIEGRREDKRIRAAGKDYVKALEGEINGENASE